MCVCAYATAVYGMFFICWPAVVKCRLDLVWYIDGTIIFVQSSEQGNASDSRLIDDLPDETKVREQFFKISGAKYITDGQVLIWVLMLTGICCSIWALGLWELVQFNFHARHRFTMWSNLDLVFLSVSCYSIIRFTFACLFLLCYF